MKIKSIKAVAVDLRPNPTTAPRVPKQQVPDWVSPMMGYSEFSKSDWGAPWGTYSLRRYRRRRHLGARHHDQQHARQQHHQRPIRSHPCRSELHGDRKGVGYDAARNHGLR